MAWDSNDNKLVISWDDDVTTLDLDTGEETEIPNMPSVAALYVRAPEGEATLPGADDAISVTLSASSLPIVKGNTDQLSAEASPWNLADKSVSWSSSNEAVAMVDAYGVVTGIDTGTAVITAASNATPSVTASCTVEVIEIRKALKAVIWNTNSEPWWSTFNAGDLPNYTERIQSPVYLNAATVGPDGNIYGATSGNDAVVYKLDPNTWAVTENLGLFAGGGAAVPDMVYSQNHDCLYFTSGKWFIDIDGMGWNMATRIPSAGNFIAMASIGFDV